MHAYFEKIKNFFNNSKHRKILMTIAILLSIALLMKANSIPDILFILSILLTIYLLVLLLPDLIKPNTHELSNIQVGFGYDVHKLEADVPLILCGTQIENSKGLKSFSDGDVAIHALIDALLGAAALSDIGTNFPNTNPAYENIASTELLKKTMTLLNENNFMPSNVDLTIVAQAPNLKPFIETMKTNLSTILNLPVSKIGIKATTEEGLGFTGKEEGMSAFCVAIIKQIKN